MGTDQGGGEAGLPGGYTWFIKALCEKSHSISISLTLSIHNIDSRFDHN